VVPPLPSPLLSAAAASKPHQPLVEIRSNTYPPLPQDLDPSISSALASAINTRVLQKVNSRLVRFMADPAVERITLALESPYERLLVRQFKYTYGYV
jgi:hypothetical protein